MTAKEWNALRDATPRCACCGGELPDEGSEAWEAAEGTCPGHLAVDDDGHYVGCGAFDPDLDWKHE